MNISAFSKRVGVSAYTLRYYEKEGLLRAIQRNTSGHRVFVERDIEWVNFITRLKETGMPLEQIKHYADLRAQGESTSAARQTLLEQHHRQLKRAIETQLEHLTALENKISFYRDKQGS